MTTSRKPLLCIHGHFYQPPRDDPFTGEYRTEPSAAPYDNWNERITAECYQPNAEAGNFGRIGFNLGDTLLRWMDDHARSTLDKIVASAARHRAQFGVANAIAQSAHHTILPLARRRDKLCQLRWGIASFKHSFGHRPAGIWLPEMAVDHETLEIAAEVGVEFVILSDEQVVGDLSQGSGPYKIPLSGNRSIAVFVRDRGLSNYLSFQMPSPDYAKEWLNTVMTGRKPGGLSLIATDGETFGHHHRQGVAVLRRLTESHPQDTYGVTTLGRYLHEHPPTAMLDVRDYTAWSCSHHLGRWLTGCPCTAGSGYWKGALRRALDNLAEDIDQVYTSVVQRYGVAPWRLRDDYIRVVLGQVMPGQFLAEYNLDYLTEEAQRQVLELLQAQVYRQRMFVSCAFFFEDLERLEPRYAIANAVQAIALVYYATGDDLTRRLRRDLGVTISSRTGRSGADILEDLLIEARFGASPLGGDMALSRPRGRQGGRL